MYDREANLTDKCGGPINRTCGQYGLKGVLIGLSERMTRPNGWRCRQVRMRKEGTHALRPASVQGAALRSPFFPLKMRQEGSARSTGNGTGGRRVPDRPDAEVTFVSKTDTDLRSDAGESAHS